MLLFYNFLIFLPLALLFIAFIGTTVALFKGAFTIIKSDTTSIVLKIIECIILFAIVALALKLISWPIPILTDMLVF